MVPPSTIGFHGKTMLYRVTFRFRGLFAILIPALGCTLSELSAQEDDGSTPAAFGGAVLGASSGVVLGLMGGVGICNRNLYGARCPRIAAAVGGALGGVSGAVLGAQDTGALEDRLRGAGYGAVIGGIVGLGLSRGVRQYRWPDVGAFLGVGAAVGASPTGAGLGFGIGAVVGSIGWLVIPEMTLGDAVAVSVLGLAAGGLAGWIAGAGAGDQEGTTVVIPFQVRF